MQHNAPHSKAVRFRYVAIAVIFLVSGAAYLNTLSFYFVYDDELQVLKNPWIRDAGHIPQIFFKDVWAFLGDEKMFSNYYRPLMHMIFMISYHVFGLKPWGFHLVNVLLNAAVSVVVFMVAAALFEQTTPSTAGEKRNGLLLPFMAALLFSTHPVHTEAVAWVSGVPELLFTLFYLLSLYFYMKDGDKGGKKLLLSAVFFFLSALSKETALTLPVILFAYDYCRPSFFQRERAGMMGLKRYIPYVVAAAAYMILRTHAIGWIPHLKRHAELSGYEYFINIFPLFAQYLGKLFWPANLNAFYVLHPISSVFEWRGTVSVSITLAFILFAYLLRRRSPTAFFGLLLIAAPLLPVLYIAALGKNTFAERYLYLPSAGFAILTAMMLDRVYRTKALGRAAAPAAIAVLIVITGFYSAGTAMRNPVWKDSYALWSDTVKKSPDEAWPHTALANVYYANGLIDRAVEHYETALGLMPGYSVAHNNLGSIYQKKGLIDRAMEHYEAALASKPQSPEIHYNLGDVYYEKGWIDRAIGHYEAAVAIRPAFEIAHYGLANAYYDRGLVDMAVEHYRIAVDLRPDYADAHYKLGIVYAKQGRLDEAMDEFRIDLGLEPGRAEAHYNMGVILEAKGMTGEAMKEFEAASKLRPDLARPGQAVRAPFDVPLGAGR
ncbi:MAG: tetratricopeptide repeat protein [Deltaproteobacteria bacterium]|nr:tetratricopeptide repeat protein [Deltaproteobacteria bacterium]